MKHNHRAEVHARPDVVAAWLTVQVPEWDRERCSAMAAVICTARLGVLILAEGHVNWSGPDEAGCGTISIDLYPR